MKTKKILATMLFIGLCLVSQAQSTKTQSKPESDPDNLAKEYFSQIMGVAVSATTNTKLYQFVYEWLGTPYRLGGDSKRGIDCSKFSFELYEKVFNTTLGYNSRNQYSQIKPVKKDDLKAGDLVFFKIRSKSITHVGVYIGDNKFAHASSSKGVMISNLGEAYWRRYYYDGGRLPDDNKSLTAEIINAEKSEKFN
ncbi:MULTISPECIES: C40 family peptidase [Sphingobacterium]|jgi:lipoprotein Spr|uniref:C40 family peptidase n=2 Tax=Sphingobacterium TaxID=28453 RepID=A0ABW5Z105_9SPHI|nr:MULTISPECIES: NlpC/P60 family protein [Sphingobacterium]KKX48589.1 glycoside hydrolase [Sphingobacterium sp. IITKGP-BTPF85]MBB2953604.1 lipoprotein Spr [Sphingobacterium sp. JUb56]MCS3554832.1 lipoprotein Spr [Sphingobacterium sp. JUb21]MCW2262750.1 lipoprotein Spr [Sphingobacterium kitahiroshimense]NJI73703.1 glycoside hydrolase [Sphingobacterium sp. B16(2022)]